MKNIASHISKQRMLQPSSHHMTAALMVNLDGEPWQNPGWRQMGCPLPSLPSSSHGNHPRWCTLMKFRMRKHWILAPDSLSAYQRNNFSGPIISVAMYGQAPIHRWALDSLTWDIQFTLINSNLFMFLLPGLFFFFCKIILYIPILSTLPLWSSPSE